MSGAVCDTWLGDNYGDFLKLKSDWLLENCVIKLNNKDLIALANFMWPHVDYVLH